MILTLDASSFQGWSIFIVIAWMFGTGKWITEIVRSKGRQPVLWWLGHLATIIIGLILGAIITTVGARMINVAQDADVMNIGMILGAMICTVIIGKILDSRKSLKQANGPQAAPSVSPQYFLFQRGTQSGPYSIAELRRMTSAGAVAEDALYCFEGATAWQPITNLDRLLRQRT